MNHPTASDPLDRIERALDNDEYAGAFEDIRKALDRASYWEAKYQEWFEVTSFHAMTTDVLPSEALAKLSALLEHIHTSQEIIAKLAGKTLTEVDRKSEAHQSMHDLLNSNDRAHGAYRQARKVVDDAMTLRHSED